MANAVEEFIRDEAELDEVLTRPTPELVEAAREWSSPLVILGAAGKMGPTLAVMARRAAEMAGAKVEVIAVSRFGERRVAEWLKERGVKTVACDLLTCEATALPEAANVIYLVGLKFGTSGDPSSTWVMNTVAPGRVMERYARARMVALSTGNVYAFSEVARRGSREEDELAPQGEYANSAVGRERVFEYFSRRNESPVALLRLLYAVDLRYGVLVDIARKVWAGEPIDLATGSFNCIWQGDANEQILRSLALANSPAAVFNLCHPQISSVRKVAGLFGELFGRRPHFLGSESGTALLANPDRLAAELGAAPTSIATMIRWTAHWVKTGGRNLGRPTHFETRNGKY